MRETIEEQNQHIGRLMEDFVRRAVEFPTPCRTGPSASPIPKR